MHASLPGMPTRVLVYTGRQVGRSEDGIEIWPADTLVEHLSANTLWP